VGRIILQDMKITYAKLYKVTIDGKVVGEIRAVSGGYQYFESGQSKGGRVFTRLAGCKLHLKNQVAP